ncbi:hypothetical protein, partial [Asanoa sp. NPDC050611]|uniref:hypothetical protein n=1 Tax=Asanoa sp. NPDC050611 TaxID=3157098 RepID=UPI0033DFC573
MLVGEAAGELVAAGGELTQRGLDVCEVDEVRLGAVAQLEALPDGGAGEVLGEPVGRQPVVENTTRDTNRYRGWRPGWLRG